MVPQLPRKQTLTPFSPVCSIHYSMKLLFPEVFCCGFVWFCFFSWSTPKEGILLFYPFPLPTWVYLDEVVIVFLPPSLQYLAEFGIISFAYVSVLASHPSARHSARIPMGLPCWPQNRDPLADIRDGDGGSSSRIHSGQLLEAGDVSRKNLSLLLVPVCGTFYWLSWATENRQKMKKCQNN